MKFIASNELCYSVIEGKISFLREIKKINEKMLTKRRKK